MPLTRDQQTRLSQLISESGSPDALAAVILDWGYVLPSANDVSQPATGIIWEFLQTYDSELDPSLVMGISEYLDSPKVNQSPVVLNPELTPSNEDPHNITSFLADGGIGRVWLAQDSQVQRQVVLKQLLPAHKESHGARDRFVHEAQLTGRLQHPNIIPVYSMNWDNDEAPFYTMKYIRGDTLAECIAQTHANLADQPSKAALSLLIDYFIAVCQAIAYAHEQTLIHRDLKPDNIAIGEFGEVTVLDWGLADHFHLDANHRDSHAGPLGTPNYMPPEQVSGDTSRMGPVSDIYSLGAILFEILHGSPPRHSDKQNSGLTELLNSIEEGDIPSAVQNCRRENRGLGHIADKCLALQPQFRYATVSDLLKDIKAWRVDQPITAKPDTLRHSVARKIRHNRSGLAAALILIPVCIIVLTGFVTKYSIESNRLAIARKAEAEKQSEYLLTKDRLESALQSAYIAKQEAISNTELAETNTSLALENERKYQKELKQSQLAKLDADNARKIAQLAADQATSSRKRKDDARQEAERNRRTAEQLTLELKHQTTQSFHRKALIASESGLNQEALAWTTKALEFATINHLDTELADYQQYNLAASLTQLPAILSDLSVDAFHTPMTPVPGGENILIAADVNNRYTLTCFAKSVNKPHWAQQFNQPVLALACSRDGQLIAVLTEPTNQDMSELVILDAKDGSPVTRSLIKPVAPRSLHLLDDKILMVDQRSIISYTLDDLSEQYRTPTTDFPIYHSVLSPDGSQLLTTHGRVIVRLWDVEHGIVRGLPIRLPLPIVGIDFQPGSSVVELVTTLEQRLAIDLEQSQLIARSPTTKPDPLERVTCADFHSHRLLSVIGTNQGRVSLKNRANSLFIPPLQFSKPIEHVHFSSDSHFLIIGSGKHSVSVFDIRKRQFTHKEIYHPGIIQAIHLSADNRVLSVQQTNGLVRQWDLSRNASHHRTLDSHGAYLYTTILNGELLSFQKDGKVDLRRVDSLNKIAASCDLGTLEPKATSFASTNDTAFVMTPKTVHAISITDNLITLDTTKLAADLQAHAVNTTTHNIALSCSDRTLHIYDAKNNDWRRIDTLKKVFQQMAWYSSNTLVCLTNEYSDTQSLLEFVDITSQQIVHRTTIDYPQCKLHVDTEGTIRVVFENGMTKLITGEFTLGEANYLGVQTAATQPTGTDYLVGNDGRTSFFSKTSLQTFETLFPSQITNLTPNGLFGSVSEEGLTLFEFGDSNAVSPPFKLPSNINHVTLLQREGIPHIITASDGGLQILPIAQDIQDLTDVTNYSLAISGIQVGNVGELFSDPSQIKRISKQVFDDRPLHTPASLSWLRANSTKIASSQWRPALQFTVARFERVKGLSTQEATKALDELVSVQLGLRDWDGVITSLLEGYNNTKQARHLYQACILAAWTNSHDVYEQSLEQLAQQVKPTTLQNYIYLAVASSLIEHNLQFSTLQKAYENIKLRPPVQPVLDRALLFHGFRLDDSDTISQKLTLLSGERIPLPIASFAELVRLLQTPPADINQMDIQRLRHIRTLLPSLEGGNPGTSWTERCLLDILFGQLQDHINRERDT